ncbi:MAG: glycosyltransferase family 4 protein [Myxococcota bacterium]
MKIVVTANYSPWSPYTGGGQRSAHCLASAFATFEHDVTAVFTRVFGESVPVPGDLPYRLRFARMPSRRSRVDAPLRPLTAATVAAEIVRLRPDVVHANGEEAALLGSLKSRLGFTLVVTPRYPSFPRQMFRQRPEFTARLDLWRRHTKYAMLGRALRAADRWCPTSESSGRVVRRAYGLDGDKMHVIRNGIGEDFLALSPVTSRRDELVFFGRLNRTKGVFDLLEAVSRLPGRAPRLCYVGRGEAAGTLRARARALGIRDRVDFVDWMAPAALARRVAHARIVVLPSWEESFGNAIAETMASGTPLVTTRVGSIPELADESTALLVPPRSPDALALAIARVLEQPEESHRRARAARALARSRFSWQRAAREFLELFARAGPRRE